MLNAREFLPFTFVRKPVEASVGGHHLGDHRRRRERRAGRRKPPEQLPAGRQDNAMSADQDLAYDAEPPRGNQVVTLVMRARTGDERAWDALVERYAPLIWSLCRRYRLNLTDAGPVAQSVWLKLADQLGKIRDPAALPGWLATTTRRECQRVLNTAQAPQAAHHTLDSENIPDDQAKTLEQGLLLAAERHAALRGAFADLPLCCQQLTALQIEDPPMSYAEISARLGVPVGSIGPNRRRCLDMLRHHPAIAALINLDEAPTA
jgi:RNA polymerase sigma factor (sigma-70 family)